MQYCVTTHYFCVSVGGKLGGMSGRCVGTHHLLYSLNCQVEKSCVETLEFVFLSLFMLLTLRLNIFLFCCPNHNVFFSSLNKALLIFCFVLSPLLLLSLHIILPLLPMLD